MSRDRTRPDVRVEPACALWMSPRENGGALFGHAVRQWARKTRRELGLDAERPLIATGHQTLLWHPGILAKYLVLDAMAERRGWATANLVVDQHVDGFGAYEIPVRRGEHGLAARMVYLGQVRPRVPMGIHAPLRPPAAPKHLQPALPSVAAGMGAIHDAIIKAVDADNAAEQMCKVLAGLMAPWVGPIPTITASDLLGTSLARAIMTKMVEDPQACATAYNRAVHARPDAGVTPLLVRDDYVELPLWRLRPTGERMRAYDDDVARALDAPGEAPRLMPRALMMTGILRLGACDLFVHGFGGAAYDRIMEDWFEAWLGVKVAPFVVATADAYLPFEAAGGEAGDVDAARTAIRAFRHDPAGAGKRKFLDEIERLPFRSAERREQFFAMHRWLDEQRGEHRDEQAELMAALSAAREAASVRAMASRRDWPFPLYPREMIDALETSAHAAATADSTAPSA